MFFDPLSMTIPDPDHSVVGADHEPPWPRRPRNELRARRRRMGIVPGRSNSFVGRHVKRTVVAFVIAPLVPPILFGITMAVWGLVSSLGIDPPVTYVLTIPIWAMFAVPVSYAGALGVGLPAFLLFRRMGWLSLERITSTTSIIGLVIGIAVGMLFGFKVENGGVFAVAAVFLAFGAITGNTFWWLTNERGKRDA